MPGHAAAAGSALGGFIEGAFGGFERTTEFKRQRRIEQQVAEQIRAKAERQDEQDTRQAELDKLDAADRERARQLEILNLYIEHGIVPIPGGAPAVGTQGLPRQAGPPAAPTQPPGADPAGDPTAEGIVRPPAAGTPISALSEKQQTVLGNVRGGVAKVLEAVGTQGLPRQAGPPAAPTQPPGADPRAVGANLLGQETPPDAILASMGFRQFGSSSGDLLDQLMASDDPVAFLGENPRAGRALERAGIPLATLIERANPRQPSLRNIDPLSPEGIEAAKRRAEVTRDPEKTPEEERQDRILETAAEIQAQDEGLSFEEALFEATQREETIEEFFLMGLTTDQIVAVDEAAQAILAGELSFGAIQEQVSEEILQAIQTRFKQLVAEQENATTR